MARFFNKNELIIIILIILLFDLNGSCFEFLNYIIFKNQKGIFAIILIIMFLIMDSYVYHTVVNIIPMPDVEYKPNNIRNIHTCKDEINEQVNEQNQIISQLKNICDSDETSSNIISEKIVFNFMAIVLIIIVICALSVSQSKYEPGTINSFGKRALKSMPIFILAILYIYIANFKLDSTILHK